MKGWEIRKMAEFSKENPAAEEAKEPVSRNFKIWRKAFTKQYIPDFRRNPTDICISDMPRAFC